MCQTISRSCLSLNRGSACAALLALSLSATTSSSPIWSTTSRELVDLEFSADHSLRILVNAPGAAGAGLYSWRTGVLKPTLLCRLSGSTTFSFDRSLIIERVAGEVSTLRVYSPKNCRRLARIHVDAKALDADANSRYVAVAVRLPENRHELRIYSHRSRLMSRTETGRNVEMGFSADGRQLVNFDLSDRGGTTLWRVPSLAFMATPTWLGEAENTFVPGSRFVKRYAGNMLSILSWPGGKVAFQTPASRDVRVRELSSNGRFGALHERSSTGEALDWIDFATGRRVRLTTGSVDHATISSTGTAMAWTLRDPTKLNEVSVWIQSISPAEASPAPRDPIKTP